VAALAASRSFADALREIASAHELGVTFVAMMSMPNGRSSILPARISGSIGRQKRHGIFATARADIHDAPGPALYRAHPMPRSGPNALVVMTTPVRLVSIYWRKSSSGSSNSGPATATPKAEELFAGKCPRRLRRAPAARREMLPVGLLANR
jgi:hypothetical protein